MISKLVPIKEIKSNPNNPRVIKNDKFDKLVQSIKDFPKMLEIRPIVVNEDNIVLGGNMRLKACIEAGLKEVHVLYANDLSPEEQNEFIIKDNVSFGEWNWDTLSLEWEADELTNWGLDIPDFSNEDNEYSTKIESPIYEIKREKPKIESLFDIEKYTRLIKEINDSKLEKNEKIFLKFAATRHIVFNYSNIAEYYAHSDIDTQNLMENSALIIIDYEKAIEQGFISMHESLNEIAGNEN